MAEENKRPGWYPDPSGVGGERWWNGAGWSDSRRSGAVVPPPSRPDPYVPATASFGPLARTTAASAAINRLAMVGFVVGIISVFFAGIILAPLAIVFSVLGIVKARALKAQGVPQTLMLFALIGLGCGVIGLVGAIVEITAWISGAFSGTL